MRNPRFVRPFVLALFFVLAGSCGSADDWFYPYDYGYDWDWDWDDYYWNRTPFGGYTIVRRPVYVVDGWTDAAFRTRPYRNYRVRRHNSPVVVYTATKGDRTVEVNLTPMQDSTRVEVRTRRGKDRWEPQPAQIVMGSILNRSK